MTTSDKGTSLADFFLVSANEHADRPALYVEQRTYTYASLSDYAASITSLVEASNASQHVGIYARPGDIECT